MTHRRVEGHLSRISDSVVRLLLRGVVELKAMLGRKKAIHFGEISFKVSNPLIQSFRNILKYRANRDWYAVGCPTA